MTQTHFHWRDEINKLDYVVLPEGSIIGSVDSGFHNRKQTLMTKNTTTVVEIHKMNMKWTQELFSSLGIS